MTAAVECLVSAGLLTREQASEVFTEARRRENSLAEEIAVERGFANEEDVYKTLAEEMGFEFIESVSAEELDGDIISLVPMSFCRENKMLPLFNAEEGVTVAIARPFDFSSLDDLKLFLKSEIIPVVATPQTVSKTIELWFAGQKDMTEKVIASLGNDGPQADREARKSSVEDLLDMTQAPVVKLVNSFIYQAIKARASDIHIEPYEDKIKVRYRIDGVLFDAPTPPKELQSLIISRLKIQSEMDIAENRLPQDGAMAITIGSRRLDIRVSTLPTKYGERIVMRILEKSHSVLSLNELGFSSSTQSIFEKLILSPHGIFLVTGPTGSGKSTTLYSALLTINSSESNIITLEDPIENEIHNISQVQVKPAIGLTFAAGLRHILRQDPDVIMVGEIRDEVTAAIAVQSALTGHLVFSTLHTNDSASTVTRLCDMGVENYLISSTVIGVLAQRLVRQLCNHCKEKTIVTSEEMEFYELPSREVFTEKGCPKCRDTGYSGRMGIFELMSISPAIQEAITSGATTRELKLLSIEEGMKTLRNDAMLKVNQGLTSISEVNRVTGM